MTWLIGSLAAAAPIWALAQGVERGGDAFRPDLGVVNRVSLWQPILAIDWDPGRFVPGQPLRLDPGPLKSIGPLPIARDPWPVSDPTPITISKAPASAPEVNSEYAAAGLSLLLGGLVVLRARGSRRRVGA